MRPLLRSVGLLALALASGSAHALGLGQIQVKSGLGEPLLAEIPVISNDPSELVDLDAGLASPETFTRIGLEPPVGIVADLRFTVGSDAQGRPVIRVTTTQPVTQPLLDFLIEVDWGQGRLVREYSATVGSPGSVAAQPAAPVQAPEVAAPAVIERPVATVPAVPPAAAEASPSATQMPRANQAPRATQSPRPTATPTAASAPDQYRVRAGDTASRIASRIAPAGVTTEQTVIGLLRANPEAFIAGDPNQLRSGSVLRVPATPELQAVEAREASELVRTYARQWRQARTQPQAPVAAADAPRTAAAPAAEGRLEIVPPGAGRKARGGTQSGIEAGGEGDMLRQELATTKETLAARDAEVQELKSRVAELEKLQADQQKLIAMQNSQMHAAQQRQAAPAQPAPKPAAPEPHGSPLPWIGGGALVLLGLLAFAWTRRRSRREPVFRAPPEVPRPSIADAFAVPAAEPGLSAPEPSTPAVETVPSWERAAPARGGRARATAVTTADAALSMPAGHAPREAPDADARVSPVDPDDGQAALQADAANVERLELAQAYLDLGDMDNARRLLGEVAETGDATARGVATKMLRDLG